jgi:hypothetical protein
MIDPYRMDGHKMNSMDKNEVKMIYDAQYDRISKRGIETLSIEEETIQATRTLVHARLQELNDFPQHNDPDDTHHYQKKLGKEMWIETDLLVKGLLGGVL